MSYVQKPFYGTLFAENYLRRTLGRIATEPYTALTELVAMLGMLVQARLISSYLKVLGKN